MSHHAQTALDSRIYATGIEVPEFTRPGLSIRISNRAKLTDKVEASERRSTETMRQDSVPDSP